MNQQFHHNNAVLDCCFSNNENIYSCGLERIVKLYFYLNFIII